MRKLLNLSETAARPVVEHTPCNLLTGLIAAGVLGLTCSAQALIIIPNFQSSITSDSNAAAIEGVINSAISTYEADYSDPITLTINYGEMSTGLGESQFSYYTVGYSNFISHLASDAKTADDATAFLHLSAVATNNPVNNSTNIYAKPAELSAIGINVGASDDGTILLNTHITDVGSPGTSGQYSLISTTEHETDEIMGLGSALDFTTVNPFAEDLFRYDGAGNRSFATSTSAKAYFSIDGTTNLAQFTNNANDGDTGDWQSNPRPSGVGPKVQDGYATPGATPTLGVELRALDVIGYDRVVPEPGTLVMGGLAVGFFAARRKR